MKVGEWHKCFYIGSLNHKATTSLPGQLEFGFPHIQKFYISHTKLHFWTKKLMWPHQAQSHFQAQAQA